MEKTHWLQSPNKNYLGHWDLPEKGTVILTIHSAGWQEVKNPINNTSEAKRVIKFKDKGYKPLICNQTNAQSILKATGIKFMEDAEGSKVELYVTSIKDKRTKENIDCIRIRDKAPVVSYKVLKFGTPLWENVISAIKDGRTTKKYIIDNYQISKEDAERI